MWCPDVYEGAPTPVTAFLVGRAQGGRLRAPGPLLRRRAAGRRSAARAAPWPLLLRAHRRGDDDARQPGGARRRPTSSACSPTRRSPTPATCCSALVAGGRDGVRAILLYLVTYLFMNLGAFVVVIAVTDAGLGDELADYRGLGRRAPWAAATMAIFLLLAHRPAAAGRLLRQVLPVLRAVGARRHASWSTLAVVGVLNSARVALLLRARLQGDVLRGAAATERRCTLRVHRGLHSGARRWRCSCAGRRTAGRRSLPPWQPLARRLRRRLAAANGRFRAP